MKNPILTSNFSKVLIAGVLVSISFFLWGQHQKQTLKSSIPEHSTQAVTMSNLSIKAFGSPHLFHRHPSHQLSKKQAAPPSLREALLVYFEGDEKRVELTYLRIQELGRNEHIKIVTDEFYQELKDKVSRCGGDISTYLPLSTYLQEIEMALD